MQKASRVLNFFSIIINCKIFHIMDYIFIMAQKFAVVRHVCLKSLELVWRALFSGSVQIMA